ncbi:hypothetical protein AURDEDRAFT_182821 [Auricularia subglabra TFB-10046 SS5]|nr:hypothetical protein AURDEDRAFT_182821 [Auricularia subglabra TFB-10046 SS5]
MPSASTTPQVDPMRATEAPPPLETIVNALNGVIDQLAPVASHAQLDHWRTSLKTVQEEAATTPEVVIGFVGVTGAGKSTLINALLGDIIVPTSGAKSCTATPIKISYHASERVRATIEFVSQESWLEEIGFCISALVDASKQVKKVDDDRKLIEKLVDDGKEGWDRIRVVYPTLTPSELLRSTPEQVLALDAGAAARLGSTETIDAPSGGFRGALQAFAPLWPLVAQVSVRCAAPVLARGSVVLVDLPGVFDSNAARGAVARDYLKRCDRVFVVAPIKRVVTEKFARDLVGQAFRSQLTLGAKQLYSAGFVTVVATCTDDISCSESMQDFLDLDSIPDWTIAANKKERLQQELTLVLADLEDGRQSTPVVARPATERTDHHKRAAEAPRPPPPKKQKTGMRVTDSSGTIDPTLLQKLFSSSLSAALAATGSSSHTAEANLVTDIVAKECRVLALQSAIREAEKQCSRVCIEVRNKWTCETLQTHFQEGPGAFFEAEEMVNFTEDEESASPAVFTVSARDYLRLQAKLPFDGNVSTVFETIEESGIPEVIEFCRQIGLDTLLKARGYHASQLSGLVSQMEYLVALHNSVPDEGSPQLESTTRNEDLYANVSHHITSSMREIAEVTSSKVLGDLDDILFAQMRAAPAKAGKEASSHVRRISKAVTHYRTQGAILRRDGSWRQHDWNAELIFCLCDGFAKIWARVLAVHSLKENLQSVFSTVEVAIGMLETSIPAGLRPQLERQKPKVLAMVEVFARQAAYKCKTVIRARQADISREMQVGMAKHMHDLYQRASTASGLGVMVQAMRTLCEGLDEHAIEMFTSVITETVEALRSAVGDALDEYSASLSKVVALIETHMPPITTNYEGRAGNPILRNLNAVTSKLADISTAIKSYENDVHQ